MKANKLIINTSLNPFVTKSVPYLVQIICFHHPTPWPFFELKCWLQSAAKRGKA